MTSILKNVFLSLAMSLVLLGSTTGIATARDSATRESSVAVSLFLKSQAIQMYEEIAKSAGYHRISEQPVVVSKGRYCRPGVCDSTFEISWTYSKGDATIVLTGGAGVAEDLSRSYYWDEDLKIIAQISRISSRTILGSYMSPNYVAGAIANQLIESYETYLASSAMYNDESIHIATREIICDGPMGDFTHIAPKCFFTTFDAKRIEMSPENSIVAFGDNGLFGSRFSNSGVFWGREVQVLPDHSIRIRLSNLVCTVGDPRTDVWSHGSCDIWTLIR